MRLAEGALLPVPEALKLLPVGRSSLYRLLKAGHVAAVKVPLPGGRARLLVVRASLEAYIANGPPPPERLDVDGILARLREEEAPLTSPFTLPSN